MSYMEQQMQQHIEAGISEADRCYNRIGELTAKIEDLEDSVSTLEGLLIQGETERKELLEQRDQALANAKEKAYEAYWQASDDNRCDRWDDDFDDKVKESFEQYWLQNKAGV